MRITCNFDLFGESYENPIYFVRNDGDDNLYCPYTAVGSVSADVIDEGPRLTLSSKDSYVDLRITKEEPTGTYVTVEPGKALYIRCGIYSDSKLIPDVKTYYPWVETGWNDSVFEKLLGNNFNERVADQRSYKSIVLTLTALGITQIADLAEGASVKLTDKQVEELATLMRAYLIGVNQNIVG